MTNIRIFKYERKNKSRPMKILCEPINSNQHKHGIIEKQFLAIEKREKEHTQNDMIKKKAQPMII